MGCDQETAVATTLPGLPDPVDEAPNSMPVQPELQPALPAEPDDDEQHEHGKPEHSKEHNRSLT
jgi:hypothetical protein